MASNMAWVFALLWVSCVRRMVLLLGSSLALRLPSILLLHGAGKEKRVNAMIGVIYYLYMDWLWILERFWLDAKVDTVGWAAWWLAMKSFQTTD